MVRSTSYNTRQREKVLEYITSLAGAHVTAAQIVKHFEKDVSVSRTTIFRCLDKLTRDGVIRRYISDGATGAYYQHIDTPLVCKTHLHLICENCDELIHLECEKMNDFQAHISNEHSFKVNSMKTVLYGKCENCQKKESLEYGCQKKELK